MRLSLDVTWYHLMSLVVWPCATSVGLGLSGLLLHTQFQGPCRNRIPCVAALGLEGTLEFGHAAECRWCCRWMLLRRFHPARLQLVTIADTEADCGRLTHWKLIEFQDHSVWTVLGIFKHELPRYYWTTLLPQRDLWYWAMTNYAYWPIGLLDLLLDPSQPCRSHAHFRYHENPRDQNVKKRGKWQNPKTWEHRQT